MGTRFTAMLAPLDVPTGDQRRFLSTGVTLAETPFPFEWVRERSGGHDGAVSIGVVEEATTATVADAIDGGWITAERAASLDPALLAVWGRGQMFDGADRDEMPRLAEDVAEAMHLVTAGTLGPSVDPDSFEGRLVVEGTDEDVDWDTADEDTRMELLITTARIRAATLVSIPAFVETSRPLELGEFVEDGADVPSLVASISAVAPARPPIAFFDPPSLTGPTPMTYDRDTGRVFGHIGIWDTCHTGFSGTCVTLPRDDVSADFAWFNRVPVETDNGLVWAGRLTVGGGHAAPGLSLSAAIAAHDAKAAVAHVRAFADDHGVAVTGWVQPGLDESTWRVLDRQKVSGDWRESPGGLTLVELLALSPGLGGQSEPGFPVSVGVRDGRQVSLVASFGPMPGPHTMVPRPLVDVDALADELDRRAVARETLRSMVSKERKALAAALGEEI